MRKKILALMLSVMMLAALCLPAGAVGTDPTIKVLSPSGLTGVDAVFADAAKEKLTLTFTGTPNTYYSIIMVKASLKEDGTLADTDPYTIGVGTILYIDQQSDASGAVSCTVYPSQITNSVILVGGSGLAKPAALATVKVPYMVGDLTEDEEVNIDDLLTLRQYLAGNITLESGPLAAADVTKDSNVNIDDLLTMRQYLAGNIPSFD